jgi:phage/plasmid primase-like uncharacterized protein
MANGDGALTISFSGTDGNGDAFADSESETFTAIGTFIARKNLSIDSATVVSLLTFAADASGLAVTDIKKIIIKNLDATNFIRIRRKDDGLHAFDEKLPAGRIAIFNNRDINVSTNAGAFSAFTNVDTIEVQADIADVRVNMYVLAA